MISASTVRSNASAAWFTFVSNSRCIFVSNVKIYLVLSLKHWLTSPTSHKNFSGIL